jgi:hypothetical protein
MVTLEMAWQNPKFDLSDYKLKDQQWLPGNAAPKISIFL